MRPKAERLLLTDATRPQARRSEAHWPQAPSAFPESALSRLRESKRLMAGPPEFQLQWRERLASGSKPASRALATALKEDSSRLPYVAALCGDPAPHVRVGALRALSEIALWRPPLVAPFAKEVVEGIAAPEADAQEAALDALGAIARLAPAETALALPLIADVLAVAKRPALREAAARCLGRLGSEVPQAAPRAADRLVHALQGAKRIRASQEAREILAALEDVLPNLPRPERAALAPRIAPLRAHPNLQVRERAGRLARELAR